MKHYDCNGSYFSSQSTPDICLLRVMPMSLGEGATQACIPSQPIVPDDTFGLPDSLCYVAGWGQTSQHTAESESKLRSARVVVYSAQYCAEKSRLEEFDPYYLTGDFNSSIEFCAGDIGGGRDTCQGNGSKLLAHIV